MSTERQCALWPVALGLVLAALLAAGAWLAWPRAALWDHGDLPYVPLAADKSLGVNADLSRLEPAEMERMSAAMAAAGFQWVRHRFAWDRIEPEPGTYDWSIWDTIVEVTSRHELRLLAVLDGSPEWARSGQDAGNPLAPPLESRSFGDFASAVALRYGDRIDYYQVWDEPNIWPHWGAQSIDPAAYARLLREAAIQVRAADPGSLILLGALAPNVEPGGANMSELIFLDSLYQEGADEWFDAVATQPYDFAVGVDLQPEPDTLNWRRSEMVRGVMEKHGDVSTAVWAVSWGLSAATPESVTQAVEQTRNDWPWLGPMLWAAWSPDGPHDEYALTSDDGELGSLYTVLRGLATEPAVAWPGVYPADHPSGNYEGDWRATPWGADIGQTGDRVTIPFMGTRLDLSVRRGDYRAFLWVTVDGQPANALPQDAQGRTYVVLYDPLRQMDTVTLARGLADGRHVAEIVAERGWGQWAIAGWTSSHPSPQRAPWLSAGLGLAALSALLLSMYGSWGLRPQITLGGPALPVVEWFQGLDDGVVLGATAGTGVLLYFMTGTIPVLVLLALLAGLLALRPEVGLPLIALTLPFYQPGRPLLGRVFSMVEILTLLTAFGWIVNWWFSYFWGGIHNASLPSRISHHIRRMTWLDWGVVVLLVGSFFSLFWADNGRVAAREFRTVILEAAIFYGLLRLMLPAQQVTSRERTRLWRVVDAWVLGGILISLVGLVQAATGQNLITADGLSRVRGFYGSPNNLALYLGRILPLALSMLAWGQRGWRRWFYGVATVLAAMAIFLTYSRGAWVVGLPISILFLSALHGRRALAATAGVMGLLAIAVLVMVGSGRLASLLNTTEGTTYFRIQLWQSSWAMVKDHPVLGVGLDNFLYHYRTYYVLPTAWEEFNLSHPHNLILDVWLRLGLLGLAAMLALFVGFFRRGWRVLSHLSGGDEKVLVQGLMAGMVYMIAHGFVDNAFFLVDLAFTFMLMVALIQTVNPTDSMHLRSQ